jgi:hypothetical protein
MTDQEYLLLANSYLAFGGVAPSAEIAGRRPLDGISRLARSIVAREGGHLAADAGHSSAGRRFHATVTPNGEHLATLTTAHRRSSCSTKRHRCACSPPRPLSLLLMQASI